MCVLCDYLDTLSQVLHFQYHICTETDIFILRYMTFPYYPNSTSIPGNSVYIVHACIKPSIKELKYNLKIIFVFIDLHLLCLYAPYDISFQKNTKRMELCCPRIIDVTFWHHVLIKTYILNCFYIMLDNQCLCALFNGI
jgi:hypothetical protein